MWPWCTPRLLWYLTYVFGVLIAAGLAHVVSCGSNIITPNRTFAWFRWLLPRVPTPHAGRACTCAEANKIGLPTTHGTLPVPGGVAAGQGGDAARVLLLQGK